MREATKEDFAEAYKIAYPHNKVVSKISPELLFDRITAAGFKIFVDGKSEVKT